MAVFINRQAPQSGIASLLALQGRGGDTELVHMTKPEVNRLQNSGLMSINPDTGLPEYFLGDVYDTVKASVKNYFKPENLIPAIASVALPAIAGPTVAGFTNFSPLVTQSILSGAGTALGSLPFRSVEDSISAGIVSGGLQYGGGKLAEFMGPSNADLNIKSPQDQRLAQRRRLAKELQNFSGKEDIVEGPPSLAFDDFDSSFEGEVIKPEFISPLNRLSDITSAELAAAFPRIDGSPQVTPLTGNEINQLSAKRFEDLSSSSPDIGLLEKALGSRGLSSEQVAGLAQQQASSDRLERFVPETAFSGGGKDIYPNIFAPAEQAYTKSGGGFEGAYEAVKELPYGDMLKQSLSSVEATGLVDAVELQRLAQEREAQRLIESGVPEPIARRRVSRRRASGEFGTGGAGLTAAEAKRRAIEGGGFEFFGPTQFVAAAQGGLVSLGHGGQPDFEGIVGGDGHGMEDNQIMGIKGGGLLAVSPKEYVVPADVMAMLGNGNPDDGADDMDKFIADFRQKKYGRDKQPPEIDGGKALQSLMS